MDRGIWEALRLLGGVLTVGGIAAIVVGFRRARRGDANGTKLRNVGIGSMLVGLAAVSAVATHAKYQPRDDARPAPIVSTDERFESSTQPAIRVVAPPRWIVSFDGDKKIVSVQRGEPDVDEDWAALMISSSVLIERADVSRMAEGIRDLPAPIDAEILDGPTMSELGGLPALRTVMKHANAGIVEVIWQVDRGGRYTSQVHCITLIGKRPDHACDGPLRSLRWIEPTDVGGAFRR